MKSMTSESARETDRELLERFRANRDREAFSQIVNRYGPVVFGVCRRIIGDIQKSEDAFQQTFFSLARFAHQINRPEALPGWLYATARRTSLEGKPIIRSSGSLSTSMESADRDPLSEITGREMLQAIEEELSKLPEEYRTAILLCGVEGLSVDEAAERLGSTNGSIRGSLQRGRAMLKDRLRLRGIELPAALTLVFGAPSVVPAATTEAAIEGAMSVGVAKSMYASRIIALLTNPGVWLLMLALFSGYMGWRVLNPIPKVPLPPLEIAKWELSTDTPLPKGAIARIGDGRNTLELGKRLIRFVDQDRVLVAVGESEFIAWEVATGKQLHRTPLPNKLPVAISPEGKWLVCGGAVLETLTGKTYWQAFIQDDLTSLHFDGEDRFVAVFHTMPSRIIDVQKFNLPARLMLFAKQLNGHRAQYLPGSGKVAVWDRLADDYDGVLVENQNEHSIRLYSSQNFEEAPKQLVGFRGEPIEVASDAAGDKFFVASTGGQLTCWNTQNAEQLYQGKILIPPSNHTRAMKDGSVKRYFFRNDIKQLHVSPLGDKAIWSGWSNAQQLSPACHSIKKQKILWEDKSTLRTAYANYLFDDERGRILINDHKIEVFDAESGKRLSPELSKYTSRGPQFYTRQMDLTKDGRLVAFGNRTIGFYDVELILDENAEPTNSPELNRDHEGAAQCGFLPGSSSIVWGANSNLAVIDVEKRKTLSITDYFLNNNIYQEDPSKSEWTYLDSWNLKFVKLTWDGSEIHKSEKRIDPKFKKLADSYSQRGVGKWFGEHYYSAIYSSTPTREIRVDCTDLSSGENRWEKSIKLPEMKLDPKNVGAISSNSLAGSPDSTPRKMSISSDGKMLAVMNAWQLAVYDSATGAELGYIESGWTYDERLEFDNVEFSRDNQQLLIGLAKRQHQTQEFQIRDLKTPRQVVRKIDLGKPTFHTVGHVNIRISQSPDGQLIAVSSGGNGLKLFDRKSGALKYHLPQITQTVVASISHDNRLVIANEANQNLTALVWELARFAVK